MNEIEIDAYLASGGRLGIAIPIDDPAYLRWILVSKHAPNSNILRAFRENEAPNIIKEQRARMARPYLLLDIELGRSVHESGGYETESDYRKKEKTWCGSLIEVETCLRQYGYTLLDLQDTRRIDAP